MWHSLFCKNLLSPSFWYQVVAAHVSIPVVPLHQTTWCHTQMSIILDLYCQVCYENYPSVNISVFNIGIYDLYGGLKFVQYNAYKCINCHSWVIDMILKFYENVFLIFFIVTTTTTTTTTAPPPPPPTTTTTTTTTATDTSILLQLSLVQCLLSIIFLQQNISEGVTCSTLRCKKEVNSFQYDYPQISLPHTSVVLSNFHLEFEPLCFVMCILMLCSLHFVS